MSGVLAEEKGAVTQHQTRVIIKALAWSSQTPLGPHGPRRMQKTVLWNVAPLKCKTMPKCHNHCAPPDHPLFPSARSGQGRWWGLWAGIVLSHTCGCSHMSIQINCAIFVPTAARCHFSFFLSECSQPQGQGNTRCHNSLWSEKVPQIHKQMHRMWVALECDREQGQGR